MSQRASIRRLDLRLRAEFPLLTSEIYELDPHHHVIYAPKDQFDAAPFAETFRKEWRQMGDHVEFTNERPSRALKVEPIADDEIGADLHGLYLTQSDLETVLAGLFPDLAAVTLTHDGPGATLTIGFAEEPTGSLRARVEEYLATELRGRPFEIVQADPPDPIARKPGDGRVDRIMRSFSGLAFKPIHRRPSVPDFVKEDETWWFDNLDHLFTGRISPRSFPFAQREDHETACYLHSTVGLQLDIRQALLAYDVVYLEPPLEDDPPQGMREPLPSFWDTQGITKADLLKLIELDRVRLLHAQPEERSDLGFLREAHEANPHGVLSRRRSAAMMIADTVETANEYILSRPHLQGEMPELARRMAEDRAVPEDELARFLLYPMQARRECFGPYMDRGLMALSSMGQGEAFARAFKRLRYKDIALEAGFLGSAVHTAHMLDATFIPSATDDKFIDSWIGPMQFMGDRLNFYRSFNTRIIAAWIGNEDRREKREIVLPPVPLLSFEDRHGNAVPIEDIIACTSYPSTRRKGRSFMSRMASLPQEERAAELASLQADLATLDKRDRRVQQALIADAGITVAAAAFGISAFPVVSAMNMLRFVLQCARKAPTLDRIVDEIERTVATSAGGNEELSFLSQIDRVATIRAPT